MKYLLICAFLLAAIVPYPAKAAGDETLQNIAAGIQIFTFLRDLTSKPANGNALVAPTQAAPMRQYTTPELLGMRRVLIEESQVSLQGTHGCRVKELLASRLRTMVSASGKAIATIGGKDLDYMANLHDFVQESGRYSPASRAQVPRGEWLAPTDVVKLTGEANLVWDRSQAVITSQSGRNGRDGLRISRSKITARVRFSLEPAGLHQGFFQGSCQAEAVVERVIDWDVNGYVSRVRGQASTDTRGVEDEVLYQATQQALIQLVNQLDLPTLKAVDAPTTLSLPVITAVTGRVALGFPSGARYDIDIPPGKSLSTGGLLLIVRNSQEAGRFRVASIIDKTVTFDLVSGSEPVAGDGFYINPL